MSSLEIPRLPDRAFSVAEARALGIPLQRLRRADLVTPFHGIRSSGEITSFLERCQALAPALAPDQFVSHTSSLTIWGLPLPWRLEQLDSPLHVTSISRRESRRRGIHGHRDPMAPNPVEHNGVPVSAPTRAWIESRHLLSIDELVIVGDALVSPWSPLPATNRPSVDELAAASALVDRNRAPLFEALKQIRVGSRSAAETRVRLVLAGGGLPEPVLNYEAHDDNGTWLGCVDHAYPARRFGIEYESEYHFRDLKKYHDDIDRRERFAEAGWRTLRVTSSHLEHPRALVERVARHLGVRLHE